MCSIGVLMVFPELCSPGSLRADVNYGPFLRVMLKSGVIKRQRRGMLAPPPGL